VVQCGDPPLAARGRGFLGQTHAFSQHGVNGASVDRSCDPPYGRNCPYAASQAGRARQVVLAIRFRAIAGQHHHHDNQGAQRRVPVLSEQLSEALRSCSIVPGTPSRPRKGLSCIVS
jgi:hypothetical protein